MVKHLLRVNYICLAMVLSLISIHCQSVKADGSRDMYPSDYYSRYGVTSGSAGDYRACLLSGITSSGSDPDLAAPYPTMGTIKVYAKAGEHIYLASSAMTVRSVVTRRSYGRIDWRAPNGKSGSVTDVRNGGLISNRAQELAGPNINGSTSGYNAYKITVGADQEGVWEIDFIGASSTLNFTSETPNNHRIESWKEDTNLPYINAFDVSVSNTADNAFIPGRVYANVLNLLMPSNYGGNSYSCEWYTTLYVLTNTGYLYEVKPNGQNGHFSTFFANNKGVQRDPEGWISDNSDFSTSKALGCYGGFPAYASLTSELNGNAFKNNRVPTYDPRRPDRKSVRMVDGEEKVTDDITHKIFFTKPASDLPASARAVYGKQVVETWLLSDLNAKDTPTLSNLNLVGKESNRIGVMGPEGVNIFFEANVAGDFQLEMNFGAGYTTRILSGVCVKGENVIEWDGKDGAGKSVPVVDVVLAGKLKAAEIHFPFFDLENNKKGLILNQLKANWSGVERDTIYWNDTNLGVSKGSSEDALDMTKGTNSPGHKWYASQSNRGDKRIIDTWTYAQGASGEEQHLTAVSRYVDLAIKSISCDVTTTHVGEPIVYTLEIENRAAGEVDFEGHMVHVDADADSASFGVWFNAGGFHATAMELVSSDDPTCEVKSQPSGDEFGMGFISLKNGKSATVRVTGYVSSKLAHSMVQPRGFIMRPGDYFEIDALNLSNDGMPLNPAQEYEGMDHNNLLELSTPLYVLNSVPEGSADEEVVAAGQTLSGNLLENDIDVDLDHLLITSYTVGGVSATLDVETPVYNGASTLCGSLLLKANGSYTFVANGDFSGQVPEISCDVSDQYTGSSAITVSDLIPGTGTSKLSIQVLPNHDPVVAPTEVLIHRTGDETMLPLSITDEDGDELTVTLEGDDKELFSVKGDSIYYVGAGVTDLTTYHITVVVNDGVKSPVSVPVTVKVSQNHVPDLTPKEITIKAKRRTAAQYLLPVRIFDEDGDKITNIAVSGNSNFTVNDDCIYFNATTTNTYSAGSTTFNLKVVLTDELGGASGPIDLKVTVVVVTDDILPSNAYVSARDIYYGDPLSSAFDRDAEVAGEWLMKRSSSVYYDDDAILPAGSYTFDLLFAPNSSDYLTEELKDIVFNVLPRPITLQSDSAEKVYDGTALTAPQVKVVEGSLVGEDRLIYGEFASLINADTIANSYTYSAAAGTLLANYDITTKFGALMVSQKIVSDYEIVVSPTSVKYSGLPQEPSVLITAGGEPVEESLYTVSYQYNVNASDSAVVIISGVADGNVALVTDTAHFSITKRKVVFESASCKKVYDGTPLTCENITSVTGDGIVSGDAYSVIFTGTLTELGSTKNAFSVQFDNDNYLVFVNPGTLTVTTKEVTLTDELVALSDVSFVYDKTAHCPTVTIVVDGMTLEQDVDYTISCVDNVAVGSATLTVQAVEGGHCTFPDYETHFDITPALVRVTDKTISDKEYDGTKKAEMTSFDYEGVLSGDDVQILVDATFEDADVAQHKQVVLSYSLVGADADNYQMESASETYEEGVITPKPISLVWSEPTSFVYDGTAKRVTATVAGTVDEEVVNVITYAGNEDAVAVGNYEVSAVALDNSNYEIPVHTPISWTITKVTEQPVVTLSDENFVYDGSSHEPTVTLKVGETVVPASDYQVEYQNNVNAGDTAMVIISALSGDEHPYAFETDTIYFSIAKRQVSYTSPSASKVFDGTPLEDQRCEVDDASMIVAGDSPTIQYTGSQTNVGLSSNTFEVVFEPDNYAVTYHYGTLTVTPKDIVLAETDVVWNETEFVYDGQEHCPTTTISVGGLVLRPNEDYAIFCMNNVNVGADVAHIAIRSTEGGNFVFTDYEVNFSISPRVIRVKDSIVESKVYDGTVAATATVLAVDNAVAGDDVNILATATFDNANAGEEKTVSVQYTLDGEAKGNYILAYESVSYEKGVVTPRPVELSWSTPTTFSYDGESHGVSATVVTDLADEVNVSAYQDESAVDAGNYTARALALDNANYQLPADASYAWNILPREISLALFELKRDFFTYDGEPHKAEFDLPSSLNLLPDVDYVVKYQVTGDQVWTNEAPIQPGVYNVTVTLLNSNYTLSDEKVWSLTIDPMISVIASSANESQGVVTGSGSYLINSNVTIEATAAEGYHFVAWNDTVLSNPHLFELTQDTTFVATFAPNNYYLDLMDGATLLKRIEVSYGEVVTEEQLALTPEKKGYAFKGWDAIFPLTIGAEDVAVKAMWDILTYQVTLEAENGTIESNFTNPVPYLSWISLTAVPNEGYHFVQWKNGETSASFGVQVTQDTTLVAIFALNEHQVIVQNGGEILREMTIPFGETVTEDLLSVTPERDHYDFVGWNPTLPFVMGDADVVVEAQWEKKRYNVTVRTENGSVADFATPVPFEERVELNVTPAEGYHFVAWKDGVLENPREIVVEQDTILEALFEPNSYTLSVVDGGVLMEQISVLYGETVTMETLSVVPTKKGYDFVGWNPTLPLVMGASDMTVEAQWSKHHYQVTLDTAGVAGSVVGDFTNPVAYETTIALNAIPAVGHHFVAWRDGVSTAMRSVVVVKDTTLSPIFEKNQVELTAVDREVVVKRVPLLYGDTVTDELINVTLEREGYDFAGWNPALPLVAGDENIVVEAMWTLKKIELTLETEFEHGVIETSFENPVTYGDTITLTVSPNEGYYFAGWSDDDPRNPREVVVVSDTVLTPVFERNQYKVTLLVDGEIWRVVPVLYGDTLTAEMMGKEPTKEDSDFAGWTPALPLVMGASDLTAEAQWSIKTFDIKMDTIFENGKIQIEYREPVAYGDTIVLTAVPAEGYHFQAWSDGNRTNSREVVIKSDTAFVPTFALNTYTLLVMNEADTMRIYRFLYGDTVTHQILDRIMPTKVGHDFAGWDVELPLFMPAHDTVIHAMYIPRVYTVIAKINGNVGVVDGEGDYDYGTFADLTAVPNRGYHFVSWGDGDTSRTIQFKVSCDTIVSALFAKDIDEMMVDSLIAPVLGYCPGSEDVMRYTLLTSEAPTEYTIMYDDEAKAIGFEDMDFSPIMADNEIRVVIPDCPARTYKAKVQFRNASNSLTPIFDVEVRVNLSNEYITDIWNDVVSAVNLENRFVAYQWYHNDVKVGGATAPYYCEKSGLSGNYYMEVVTVEGEHLRTCKKWFDNGSSTTLSVYPNPTAGIATVELSADNGDVHRLEVTNQQGVVVYTTTFVGRKLQVDFSRFASGAYVVNVDGLTVKEIRR